MSRLIHTILIALGTTFDPNRPFDPEYYLPKEWKGKSVNERAAMTIAAGYQDAIRKVKSAHPELAHVEEASNTYTHQ